MKKVIRLKESDINRMVNKVIREQNDFEEPVPPADNTEVVITDPPVEPKSIDTTNMIKDIKTAYGEGCHRVGSSKCNPESIKAWLDIVYRTGNDNQDFNDGIRYYADKEGVDMTPSIELIEAIAKYI